MRVLMAGLVFLLFVQVARPEQIHPCSTGNVRAIETEKGNVLMRDDGTILSDKLYCGPAGSFADGLIALAACETRDEYVFMSATGEKVFAVAAESVGNFSEGLASIERKGKHGYIDKTGRIVIEPQFDKAEEFSEGVASVAVNDEWEYIDKNGNVVFKVEREGWDVMTASPFKSGAAFVLLFNKTDGNDYVKGLVDHSGRWLFDPTVRLTGYLGDGLVPLSSDKNKLTGFADKSGQMVIAPQFTWVSDLPFEEGLAAVYIGKGESMRAGFIDKTGSWVLAPIYENAYHFCGGLAPVEIDRRWGFIDKTGRLAIPPRFESAESFENGIAEVIEKDEKGVLHKAYINRDGKILFRDPRAGW